MTSEDCRIERRPGLTQAGDAHLVQSADDVGADAVIPHEVVADADDRDAHHVEGYRPVSINRYPPDHVPPDTTTSTRSIPGNIAIDVPRRPGPPAGCTGSRQGHAGHGYRVCHHLDVRRVTPHNPFYRRADILVV